ncbi:calcium-activated chloride channel regulator 1-like isoform X2 [Ruditapes philippinarum]|nr:calcium-activated chloride channel regulator 1-like isoform X2 [Ruditapes philippinarum]
MTKASKYLYTATRERAFFKEIKILLPATWSRDPRYVTATSENLAFADVIITDPIRGKRSLPQARSYDGCGKQGVHVLLSKEFLTIPRAEPYFNDPAKYFIHAFAQFRWGVFQEYPEEGESEFYISVTNGRPEAIRCTIQLRGLVQKNDSAHTICYLPSQAQNAHVVASVDNVTGLYERECLWRPYPTRQRTKASIMDHQYITNIETFCDDNHTDYMTVHNFEAPSKHNRLCGHRSTWDIITQTDDFRNGRNPPHGRLDAQLEPTFIVMRAPGRKRRAAILIDPSLTKQTDIHLTIGHLKQESSIHDIEIVLVKHVDGRISHQQLQSVENIESYLKHHSPTYKVSLTDQITQTVQMMEEEAKGNDTHFILVTDKESSELKKMLTESKQNGLKFSAILNTHNPFAGNLDNLHTVGKEVGHTLLDRLRNIILEETPRKIVITTDSIHLSNMVPVSNSVLIDQTLVNHVTFIFHYDVDQPNIDLRSPSAVIYGVEDDVCTVDYDLRVIRFHLEFTEVGTWTYTVMQTSRSSQNVRVTVISEEENIKIDPIVLKHSVKTDKEYENVILLHVDAMQGSSPLTGLTVVAKIETPEMKVEHVTLLDNGAGVDISKNDGIYSRTFIAPRINGSYHVTYMVTSNSTGDTQKEKGYTKKDNTHSLIESNFQRQIPAGTVHISRIRINDMHAKDRDVIPPSRMTDLEAVTFIPYRNSIVLKWTTPGDDFDHGKPSGYHLYIGYDINNVRSFLKYISSGSYDGTGHVANETIAAKSSATETEIFLWNVKMFARTYVFAVRAFDDSGNIGDISNVVTTTTSLRP